MTDQAFQQGPETAIAKIGVLVGSLSAATLGSLVLAATSRARQPVTAA